MEQPTTPAAPAKLYAFLLKLRPIEQGTLMAFSGELVHGAFLDWIRLAAPDVAAMLHDGNKRRLFTCSSLQFPIPQQRMLQAERDNVHVPLDPEKTYVVRVTLLLGELFPLFYNTLLHFNMADLGTKRRPFMRFGKQQFLLEEVIADTDDRTGWTGFTSFGKLVEQANVLKFGKIEPLTLEFASLTTFNRGSPKGRMYENYYARLPLPHYIFPGLARRWQELAPPELAGMVQKERIEEYIADEGIVIEDYVLQAHRMTFINHPQKGFVGQCKYHLRLPDGAERETMLEGSLNVRQQIVLLSQLAFYTGIGYKTAMGMGRVRPLPQLMLT